MIYNTRFLIAWSHRECACIFIHSHCLPFWSIKLADFIVPEANFIPLLTFERVHFAKFHFHLCVFPRNTGLGTDILFINWSDIARSLVKKISIPDWHLFITQMETKWTKWYAMTSHVIAYRSPELLFGTHTFHFNCIFTQIRCLSRVAGTILGIPQVLRLEFWKFRILEFLNFHPMYWTLSFYLHLYYM